MTEIYRFTVLHKRTARSLDLVKPPTGNPAILGSSVKGPEWDLSRVPEQRFLRQLDETNEPPASEATLRPLIEALGQRPTHSLEAQTRQLQELVRHGAQVRAAEAGLGAVVTYAAAARPMPIDDLITLTRIVVAVQTLREWANQLRRNEDWKAGRSRPMLRPVAQPEEGQRGERREARIPSWPMESASPSSTGGALAMLRRSLRVRRNRRTSTLSIRGRGDKAPQGPNRTSASWQDIAGLVTFASVQSAKTELAPVPDEQLPHDNKTPSLLEPVGSQDLIVVRTRHLGYRLAELSRIENIAPGETRDRRHRIETETSSVLFQETEHEEENTESLATTTRDELRTEIATQSSRKLNLTGSVRASYRGPVNVDVEATAEFNQQSGIQTTAAGAHAVDVVDEAASSVRDRVLRRNEHRFRRLLAESNRHKFQNDTSEGRLAQYYWLEKIERVALFNYGRRAMYEFVVPEPASFLRALGAQAPPVQTSVPAPPTEYYNILLGMKLDELEAEFTSGRVSQHFTVNVGERPTSSWVEAYLFERVPGPGDEQYSVQNADLAIPSGYEGVSVLVSVQTSVENKDIWPHLTLSLDSFKVHLQGRTLDNSMNLARCGWGEDPSQNMINTNGLRVNVAESPIPPGRDPLIEGSHKVALIVENFGMYSVSVGVLASPTQATIENYQRSILAAVVTDYASQYETYAAQALVSPPSGPTMIENLSDAQAAELRKVERDEIKRAALAIIRNADATGPNPINRVEPEVASWFAHNRALADEILFLEQAFEWEHMNFILYGYQWSDQTEWPLQVFGFRGGDRPFREFLKAGAARVQLPVRPGFAKFVDDYMMQRVVWSGGPRPGIGSAGYVDFITERSEQLGAPAHEKCQTEYFPDGRHQPIVWDVVTPTDLVLLKVWADGAEPPLERMVPPSVDSLIAPGDVVCANPLEGWTSGTGVVPDDPST